MEKKYVFNSSSEKLIEKLIDDDVVMINHFILNEGDFVPEHKSNSNVYLLVVRGILDLKLADNASVLYEFGNIVNVPYDVNMTVSNTCSEQLELFVIKAPSPRVYGNC